MSDKNSTPPQEQRPQNLQDENLEEEKSELDAAPVVVGGLMKFLVFGFIASVFLVFTLVHFLNDKSDKGNTKKEDSEIGTSVKKTDLSFSKSEGKSIAEQMQEVKEQSDKTQQTSEKTEEKSKFDFSETKSRVRPKVFKTSNSLLIASSSRSSDAISNANDTHEPIDPTDPNVTFDEDGKLVYKSEAQIPETKRARGADELSDAPAKAKKIKFDPNLYIAKGTYIGCSLNTRLVSQIGGGIACTISENIYSANGNVLLIEKGSKVIGSFRSGQLDDGMNRIFVIWEEIRTPNNLSIAVDSGASDTLGGSGIEGYIDHHWLQRFGAAILLSMVDDASNVALNGGSGTRSHENTDYSENTREATREMANTALEKFINIQPTLYVNQGDLVGIYVNRDLDFSDVYSLRLKGIRYERR